MQKELKNLLKVLIALAVVILFFTLIRSYFYFLKPELFSEAVNLPAAFAYGLFYDTLFVLTINGLVFFLFFFPFRIRNTVFWQGITKISFVFINLLALLFYLLSVKFYDERLADFLTISNSPHFIGSILYNLSSINYTLANSWDLLLLSAFMFIVLWHVFPSINDMLFERSRNNKISRYVLSVLGLIFWAGSYLVHTYYSDRWQTILFQRLTRNEAILSLNSPYKLLHLHYAKPIIFKENGNSSDLDYLFTSNRRFSSRGEGKRNLIVVNVRNEAFEQNEIEHLLNMAGFDFLLKDNFYATHKSGNLQLDELLLSIPAFISQNLFQTKNAFGKINSLADVLQQNGYQTFWLSNLTDTEYKALANFYNFGKVIVDEDLNKAVRDFSTQIQKSYDNYFAFVSIDNGLSGLMDFLSEEYLKNTLILININPVVESEIAYGKTAFLIPQNLSKLQSSTDTLTDLDIFPCLIDYLGIHADLQAFGNSIFHYHENDLFQFTGNDYLMMNDSLLLSYSGDSTVYMINHKKGNEDVQDVYPVEKIALENKIRAIIKEYEKVMK